MDIKADDIQGIIQQPTLLIHSAWLEIQKATADESIYKQKKSIRPVRIAQKEIEF